MKDYMVYPEYAFDCIVSSLKKTPRPEPKFENDKSPLFVTWTMSPNAELRGCIGTFEAISVHKGVEDYAKISAFEDMRFDPITVSELESLICTVSLLKCFENGDDIHDFEMSTHGITLKFSSKGKNMCATYLPEVTGTFPSKDAIIKSLMNKAGYYGKLEDIKDSMKIERYQSCKYTLSYKDYINRK
ncbi:hypothetical protein A3Q56_04608 [Intoshia linei]|uniref:AMMECR1 domain-containing protein n=1 Tax=Intoshia linei TaxID=1819745 RepID=A0A177B031_9BILA|nr:hypothetical protein A3Q56_04608 [Intoshia linei]